MFGLSRISNFVDIIQTYYQRMNTNKTYIAFDSEGVLDHVNSNLHTFHQLADWQKRYPSRFQFINIDEIDFSSEHDDLVDITVKTNFS